MDQSESVCVAVHIRPLIDTELGDGCTPCLDVTPGAPQVGHGPHTFTYDHVFGGDFGSHPSALYHSTVSPLVDGLFNGYNATVFAYGQTGSGKTYTMGSSFGAETLHSDWQGVIPQAMRSIFDRIAASPDSEFTIRVGFVEIHKEDIRDLLAPDTSRTPQVSIRELPSGGIVLAGAAEKEVKTVEEMVAVLQAGTVRRATAATGMNKQSSRSHAIFTITLEQRKLGPAKTERSVGPSSSGRNTRTGRETVNSGDDDEEGGGGQDAEFEDEGYDDFLTAKLALVDLAGSERLKRTRAEGQRLKEGININKGLLALGNVISALSEGKTHIPYRDSKLTRMLQDSLGGNSRTVMIACVSPADVNLEESLNTLRYASRARNIKNRPVVNRDPIMAQIAALRAQLAGAKSENDLLRRKLAALGGDANALLASTADGSDGDMGPGAVAALQEMKSKSTTLEKEIQKLKGEAAVAKKEADKANKRMIVAQSQRDRLAAIFREIDPAEADKAVKAVDSIATGTGAEGDVLTGEMERMASLEQQVTQLKALTKASAAYGAHARRNSLVALASNSNSGANTGANSPFAHGNGGHGSFQSLSMSPALGSPTHRPSSLAADDTDSYSELEMDLEDEEAAATQQAHEIEMARVASEMDRLQMQLESKQKAVAEMSKHSVLKQKYDKQLSQLQKEKEGLAKERAELMSKIEELRDAADEERKKVSDHYRARIKELDVKVKSVKAKERRVMELEKMKQRADETCQRLEGDIQQIKAQRVNLIRAAEKAQKEHNEWKRSKDREMLQLRKKGMADQAKLKKLETLHARQQQVLRRKMEEAEAARKRLKEIQGVVGSRHLGAVGRAHDSSSADGGGTAPLSARGGSSSARQTNNSIKTAATDASPTALDKLECQPNSTAPVLKTEKAVKSWVQQELDVCCTSYDLQKVIEGEKAARSEAARELREVERRIAAANNPDWWPAGTFTFPALAGLPREGLFSRKTELLRHLDTHSSQIQDLQLQLVKARAEEEERGQGAADAKRWTNLKNVGEAKMLLQSVFQAASQQRAAVQEAQLSATELGEEVELLRLKLEIAEQEKIEGARALMEARAAAAAAAALAAEYAPEPNSSSNGEDATDADAASLLKKLQALPEDPLQTINEEDQRTADEGDNIDDDEYDNEPLRGAPPGGVNIPQEASPSSSTKTAHHDVRAPPLPLPPMPSSPPAMTPEQWMNAAQEVEERLSPRSSSAGSGGGGSKNWKKLNVFSSPMRQNSFGSTTSTGNNNNYSSSSSNIPGRSGSTSARRGTAGADLAGQMNGMSIQQQGGGIVDVVVGTGEQVPKQTNEVGGNLNNNKKKWIPLG